MKSVKVLVHLLNHYVLCNQRVYPNTWISLPHKSLEFFFILFTSCMLRMLQRLIILARAIVRIIFLARAI